MAKATRYTDKQKKDIVAFVKKYDADNGRGGQSAAKKKFNVNPISIKKWCVEQGYTGTSTRKKKKAPAAARAKAPAKATKTTRAKRTTKKKTATRGRKPAAAKATAPSVAPKSGSAATLKKLTAIADKIDALHAQFDALKKTL